MNDVGGTVLLHTIVADAYKRGLAAGIAQERERCARVAEDHIERSRSIAHFAPQLFAIKVTTADQIAADIRAGDASE